MTKHIITALLLATTVRQFCPINGGRILVCVKGSCWVCESNRFCDWENEITSGPSETVSSGSWSFQTSSISKVECLELTSLSTDQFPMSPLLHFATSWSIRISARAFYPFSLLDTLLYSLRPADARAIPQLLPISYWWILSYTQMLSWWPYFLWGSRITLTFFSKVSAGVQMVLGIAVGSEPQTLTVASSSVSVYRHLALILKAV